MSIKLTIPKRERVLNGTIIDFNCYADFAVIIAESDLENDILTCKKVAGFS